MLVTRCGKANFYYCAYLDLAVAHERMLMVTAIRSSFLGEVTARIHRGSVVFRWARFRTQWVGLLA
jgi:hypothetical protein